MATKPPPGPSTIREIADRLNALGLGVPLTLDPEFVLAPNATEDEIRKLGSRLIAASPVATDTGDDIGTFARKMHALAQKADPTGAPRLVLGPEPRHGTIIDFRDGAGWKRRMLEEDAYATRSFLDRVAVVFHEQGWPWRFVETATEPAGEQWNRRLLLVPATIVAELSQLALLEGGAPAAATPVGSRPTRPPELPRLRTPEDVIGAAHYLCSDGESVDGASAYVGWVADLARLTDGHLNPTAVSCVEQGEARRLTITAGERRYEALVKENYGWLDLPPLLACLNEILADGGAPGRLYEQYAPTRGQEIAVAFATPAEARALEAEGCKLT